MTARRVLRRVAAAAVLAALPAACSGDGDPPASAGSTTTAVAATTAAEPGANAVTIGMGEYAFDVEGSVVAGTSTVVLRNSGREMHMAGFGLLREGRTLDDVIEALASEDASAFDEVFAKELNAPGGLLGPGEAMEITTPFLGAGTYAVMCFVPTVGEDVPHTAKGMLTELVVGEGDARVAPAADATYSVGAGTIEGPTSLKAGRVTLEVRSGAGGPHEFTVARKKSPTTTFAEIDAAFTSLFEGEVPPAPGYTDALPAAIAGNVFDVESGATVSITLDLRPGDYLVGCAREPAGGDGPAAAEHTGEQLEVKVA